MARGRGQPAAACRRNVYCLSGKTMPDKSCTGLLTWQTGSKRTCPARFRFGFLGFCFALKELASPSGGDKVVRTAGWMSALRCHCCVGSCSVPLLSEAVVELRWSARGSRYSLGVYRKHIWTVVELRSLLSTVVCPVVWLIS